MSEKVLLIWEEVPDYTKMYELDAGSEEARLAVLSANKYINSDDLPDDHPIFKLNELLEKLTPSYGRNVEDAPTGVIYGPYKFIVFCGFYL